MKQQHRLLGPLSGVFRWLGHLTLLSVLALIAFQVMAYWQFFRPGSSINHLYQFSFLRECATVAERLANGFLFYLVGTVFSMIQHGQPVQARKTWRITQACCALFALNAALELAYQIMSLAVAGNPSQTGLALAGILHSFTPLLYAICIFIIYRHFANMVEFEAGVV